MAGGRKRKRGRGREGGRRHGRDEWRGEMALMALKASMHTGAGDWEWRRIRGKIRLGEKGVKEERRER
eukprot:745829-Hanusia_phi.AAC.2